MDTKTLLSVISDSIDSIQLRGELDEKEIQNIVQSSLRKHNIHENKNINASDIIGVIIQILPLILSLVDKK